MQVVLMTGNTHNGTPSYEGYRCDRRISHLHRAEGGIEFIMIAENRRLSRLFGARSSFGLGALQTCGPVHGRANETASA